MPKQGMVDISVATRPGSPPGTELTVTSEGTGPPDQREQESLGLAVVRTIIRAHGGTLELKPGSAVVFLPGFDSSELGGTSGLAMGTLSGRKQRIALVDDEAILARATERLVSMLGYEVTMFSSAEQVLRAFNAAPDAFELVLTDQTMPEMTGLELTHALRAKGLRPNHSEGYPRQEWILLDFGGLVVHVFTERLRVFYDLERLWGGATRLEVRAIPPSPPTR